MLRPRERACSHVFGVAPERLGHAHIHICIPPDKTRTNLADEVPKNVVRYHELPVCVRARADPIYEHVESLTDESRKADSSSSERECRARTMVTMGTITQRRGRPDDPRRGQTADRPHLDRTRGRGAVGNASRRAHDPDSNSYREAGTLVPVIDSVFEGSRWRRSSIAPTTTPTGSVKSSSATTTDRGSTRRCVGTGRAA
jgi:hypothetical protein